MLVFGFSLIAIEKNDDDYLVLDIVWEFSNNQARLSGRLASHDDGAQLGTPWKPSYIRAILYGGGALLAMALVRSMKETYGRNYFYNF